VYRLIATLIASDSFKSMRMPMASSPAHADGVVVAQNP